MSERLEAFTESLMDATQNLLAVIHRDGGQYTQDHGIFRSARDAEQVVVKLIQERDTLKAENAELKELSEKIEAQNALMTELLATLRKTENPLRLH